MPHPNRVRTILPTPRSGRRLLLALAGATSLGGLSLVAGAGAPAGADTPSITAPVLQWTQNLPDAGSPIALSSPNVATLDGGGPSVVVGDRAGKVYAFHLSNGSSPAGWPFATGAPVDSTPSVDGAGFGLNNVFVGTGNAASPYAGGYQAIGPGGNDLWFTQETNPSTDPYPHNGVQASLAVGNLQGGTDVVAGSLGENEDALNAANGAILAGFPWFQADSNFTTPALADVFRNGQTEIVEGGDSSAGIAYGTTYSNGGHLRIISPTGNAGQPTPSGGYSCQYNTDQTVQSSPAVGNILSGLRVGHRLRHRHDLRRRLDDQQAAGRRRRLQPAVVDDPRRGDERQPGPGRRPGQRAAPGGRRHQQRERRRLGLGPQQRQRRPDLARCHRRGGLRLGRHRRPRRRLSGPDRAHDQRRPDLRRQVRRSCWPPSASTRASRTPRSSPTTPTGPSASPSPATPSTTPEWWSTGRSRGPTGRWPTSPGRGRCSTTTPS